MLWVHGEWGAELPWSWCIPTGLCITVHGRHPWAVSHQQCMVIFRGGLGWGAG